MNPPFIEEVIGNDLTFTMIFVEGGQFEMGDDTESPAHEVIVSDFYIAEYPVTQLLWKEVFGSSDNPSNLKGNNHPVESVSWESAKAFIQALNRLTKRDYRLPTEAEWEYAALGGTKGEGFLYAGGDNLDEVGWYDKNCNEVTQEVGLLKPNELGLYDLSGNVWEWCEDLTDFDNKYYEACHAKGIVKDPINQEVGNRRALRGGSAFQAANPCRIKYRYGSYSTTKDKYHGFRLALPAFPAV